MKDKMKKKFEAFSRELSLLSENAESQADLVRKAQELCGKYGVKLEWPEKAEKEKIQEETDEYLPGFKEAIPKQNKEIRKQEEEDFMRELVNRTSPKCRELETVATQPTEMLYCQAIEKLAESYQLELPENIKRKLRHWEGKDSFAMIKRNMGMKTGSGFISWIHNLIPLSLKGYTESIEAGARVWKQKTERGEKILYITEPKPDTKPAYGDLPKRAIKCICHLAAKRETLSPGPIKFRDLLEMLGELNCSQDTRRKIRDYIKSFAKCGMEIQEIDKQGKQVYYRYTPFLYDFIWDGKLEFDATIFPYINPRLFVMVQEENLVQYNYIENVGKKELPGMTDRDALALDMFTRIRGFPAQNIGMRKFLYDFGQFPIQKLQTMGLKQIRDWVNKVIRMAKETDKVTDIKVRYFRDKKKYLDQTITIFPKKWHKDSQSLSGEDKLNIQEVAEWIKLTEHYVHKPQEEIEGQLANYSKLIGIDAIMEAYERWQDSENWYPDYDDKPKSSVMKFFDEINEELKEAKEKC